MKLSSNQFTHGSRHFSNSDLQENGQKIVDLKQQWILALMMQCKCSWRSILRLLAVSYLEFVENSIFQTSSLIQMVKWQQQDLDSNTLLYHLIMILFEIWLKLDKLLIHSLISWFKTRMLRMRMMSRKKEGLYLLTLYSMFTMINTHILREFCLKTHSWQSQLLC